MLHGTVSHSHNREPVTNRVSPHVNDEICVYIRERIVTATFGHEDLRVQDLYFTRSKFSIGVILPCRFPSQAASVAIVTDIALQ